MGRVRWRNDEKGAEAFLLVDASGRIGSATGEATEMFGYAPGALVGRKVSDLVPRRSRATLANLHDGLQRRDEVRERMVGLRRDRDEFSADVSLRRLANGNGEITVVSVLVPEHRFGGRELLI